MENPPGVSRRGNGFRQDLQDLQDLQDYEKTIRKDVGWGQHDCSLIVATR